MIVERTGDIFTTEAAAIGHGCNCRGSMGAGIAAQIKKRYPAAFEEYRAACAAGTFRPGAVQLVKTKPRWILNMATQDSYGRPVWKGGSVWASSAWIEECLITVRALADEHRIKLVAFPRVGCELGGLFWDLADFEEKKRRFGPAVGSSPEPSGYVKQILTRVFESASVMIELWTYARWHNGECGIGEQE